MSKLNNPLYELAEILLRVHDLSHACIVTDRFLISFYLLKAMPESLLSNQNITVSSSTSHMYV